MSVAAEGTVAVGGQLWRLGLSIGVWCLLSGCSDTCCAVCQWCRVVLRSSLILAGYQQGQTMQS
jgi:hypothetical protein